jgi:hypothetical protein
MLSEHRSATVWGLVDLILALVCATGAALTHHRALWLVAAGFIILGSRQLDLARRLNGRR